METGEEPRTRRQRNWWKIAFFVLLVVFEVTREWAVIAHAEKAQPNASGYVGEVMGYVSADGSWKRLDDGSPLIPGVTKIECWRERGECTEASVMVNEQYVSPPTLDRFAATFTEDAVSYENDIPDCANYSVRIDLKLKKVFALRERKANAKNPECAHLEPRIEMQLVRSFETVPKAGEGHFLPILWVVVKLLD